MIIFPTKILVATDGSKEAELAVRTGADLAEKTASELHLVHVFGIAPWYPVYAEATAPEWMAQEENPMLEEDLQRTSEQRAGEILDTEVEKARSAGSTVAQAYLREGGVAAEIVTLAEDIGAGLIVRLRPEELHERAWEVVRPRFSEARQKAAARYRQLAGTGQTSRDIRKIVAAAYYGRVETLFAASGTQRWGVFDPDTGEVDLHEGPEAGDLLEFAAIQTVLHHGTVYVTNPENMPTDADVVSVFRY